MTGTAEVARPTTGVRGRWLTVSPLLLLAATLAAACTVLAAGPHLPLGPMYWDLYQYYDAAQRIASGQVPVRDFFLPVGPLAYYLFAGALAVFPGGSAALLAQWSMLVVTAPLMALVVRDVAKRTPLVGFALLLPFLFFALLPINTREYYPFPGVDGFGTYNRHVCELLYVLVAAIVFVRSRRVLTLVLAVSLSALFFLKMTGFLAAAALAGYALLAGRVRARDAAVAAGAFGALLVFLELATGLVGDYVGDVLALVGINSALLLPRFLQAMSLNVGVITGAVLLAGVLMWTDRRMLHAVARSARESHSATRMSVVADHVGPWLLVVVAVGVFNETQNLGSQALIFLWPVCLRVFLRIRRAHTGAVVPVALIATLALLAASVLPPVVNTFERASRAVIGSARNVPLDGRNLKALGHVSMRPEVAERVDDMLAFYPAHRDTLDDLVAMGDEATPLLYSDVDFQALYLAAVDRAIDAIRRLEAERGVHFETITTISNYNLFPYLMDRTAPRHVSIAADPMRTVPTPDGDEAAALRDTDLLLYPTCPPTVMSAELLELYSSAIADHRRIRLSDCYDAFVNPRFTSVPAG